jgi:hypothetical protein
MWLGDEYLTRHQFQILWSLRFQIKALKIAGVYFQNKIQCGMQYDLSACYGYITYCSNLMLRSSRL